MTKILDWLFGETILYTYTVTLPSTLQFNGGIASNKSLESITKSITRAYTLRHGKLKNVEVQINDN